MEQAVPLVTIASRKVSKIDSEIDGEIDSASPSQDSDVNTPARRLTAAQRRDQLFNVALDLFARRGYRATTMDEIAEIAGVTKPLLYQHFDSKRALYLELVDSISRDLMNAVAETVESAGNSRELVEFGFAAYFRVLTSHEAGFRLLYGRDDADDRELGDALRRVEDAIADTIDPLIDAGLEPEHRKLLAFAVVGMAEGASRYWISQRSLRGSDRTDASGEDGGDEAARLAARISNLAWAGLRSVHAD